MSEKNRCVNVLQLVDWLSVKAHVFSTFQTHKNFFFFFTEVVVCHSVILKGFGCTKSPKHCVFTKIHFKNICFTNMHHHVIGGCTKEINKSLLSFQKAEECTACMECFKLVACLSCENVEIICFYLYTHTLKAH